jgi:hypothetical protein
MSGTSDAGKRQRGSLGVRAAVATVVAGGLAAGSYGIASAASANGASGPSAGQALATASSPSKTATPPLGRLRFGGPGFGPRGIGPGFGVGGTITAITAKTITVTSMFGKSVTVTTDKSTVYREGDKKVARSALSVGEQVFFLPTGRPGAPSSSSSKVVAAVEIVQPYVAGKVVSVSGSQIVVSQSDGLNVTVNISQSTTYGEVGHSASAEDIHSGTVVLVTGSLSSNHDQIDAGAIQIVPASLTGQVTSVSGKTIKVKTFGGTTETVTTDSTTLFNEPSGKTTIASVKKGAFVEVFGTSGAGNSFVALTVMIGPSLPPRMGGHRGFSFHGGFGGNGGLSGFGGPRGAPGGPGGWPAGGAQSGSGSTTTSGSFA